MDIAPLQNEYGVFNPRFLGVTLKYDSTENYHAILDFLMHEDVRGGGDLNQSSLFSVLDHEGRHYHDFLLSPYSYRLFRLRLQALANGSQMLSMAKSMAGTHLPVPLLRWLTLTDPERREAVAGWQDDVSGQVSLPPLPHRTSEQLLENLPPGLVSTEDLTDEQEFQAYADITARSYARIQQLTDGFATHNGVTTPRNIHEVSALGAQIASIYRSQGPSAAVEFILFLMDSKLAYAAAWQIFFQVALLLDRSPQPKVEDMESLLRVVQRMQSLTVWCLLGNYDLDGIRACPSVRFELLLSELMADPRNSEWVTSTEDTDSLTQRWDYWDRRTAVSRWRESLTEMREFAERGTTGLRRFRAAHRGDHHIPDLLLAILQDVNEQQRSAVDAFMADPATLGDAWRYVQAPPGLLPHFALKIELVGHAVDIESLGRARIINRLDTAGRTYAWSFAIPAGVDQVSAARLERALEFEALSEWCDFAFSDHLVPEYVASSARRGIAGMTKKRTLAII